MRVFSGSLDDFQRKLDSNTLFQGMEEIFGRTLGRTASPGEIAAWKNSLPRLGGVLRLARLRPDVHVTLEEGIPYFSKRIDACLFGHTEAGNPHAVVVELKGWSEASATEAGNVETWLGGARRTEPHPSAQAMGYQGHLEDYRRAFQGQDRIGLASCAYCHNYPGIVPDEGLFHPQFDLLRGQVPTFGERDADVLARYLDARLRRGNGQPVLDAFDRAGVGPSKSLVEHAGELIRGQGVFRLLDEQLAANNEIIRAIRRAMRQTKREVILVRGGPGTGKSVVALNVMGEVMRQDQRVFLVSGSSAFTNGMRRILGPRLEGQVRFTDFFWDKPDGADVLIVDEAHRIRSKSEPKVVSALRPKIRQVDELIRAARVTVFFVDENQIISPSEVGEPRLVEEAAARQGATYQSFQLTGQFRCAGSTVYLDWLDDMLELTPERKELRLVIPTGFDFDVVASPHELLADVRRRNAARPNSARLLAGWCWQWSDPLPNGLVEDIVIGDFRFPWESKQGKRPPPGIPEAKHWAIEPAGVGQAGTVYSVQGFESPHVGVIIGPDLVVRGGRWIAQPKQNFSNSLRGKKPEVAAPFIKRIYRTLLSRPTQSCRIFCADSETQQFLRERLLRP